MTRALREDEPFCKLVMGSLTLAGESGGGATEGFPEKALDSRHSECGPQTSGRRASHLQGAC